MTILELIEQIDGELRNTFVTTTNRKAFVVKHHDEIKALLEQGIRCSCWSNNLDFDRLSHDQVVKVMLAFPGEWDKQYTSSTNIDYILDLPDEKMRVRCWQGAPPPNCKIIEVDQVIPAQPERTVKVRKLQCIEPKADENTPVDQIPVGAPIIVK